MKIAFLPLALAPLSLCAKTDNRPNIVVILADDLLRDELSCYGGSNVVTKNIDQLARQGMIFNHNFASEAISAPVRSSLYTGLYPVRNGTYYNHKAILSTTKTVNDYLPSLGYRVARTGKQHTKPAKQFNFTELAGFPKICTASKVAPTSTATIEQFMSKSDDPFLLYVCSINPHAPWTQGDSSKIDPDKIKLPKHMVNSPQMRKLYADYLAEVMVLDNEVALVREAIERVGKSDNTMILFLGENGSQFPGGKWSCWHAGVSSAMIAYYPPQIKAGVRTDAVVQYEDVLPTIIDIAGGEPLEHLDGLSFKNVLHGKKKKHRELAYFIYNNNPEGTMYSVRGVRDKNYTLIRNYHHLQEYKNKHIMGDGKRKVSVTWEAWLSSEGVDNRFEMLTQRYIKRPEFELYDNKKDPDQLHNLAQDKRYDKVKKQLLVELDKWMQSQGDTDKTIMSLR